MGEVRTRERFPFTFIQCFASRRQGSSARCLYSSSTATQPVYDGRLGLQTQHVLLLETLRWRPTSVQTQFQIFQNKFIIVRIQNIMKHIW